MSSPELEIAKSVIESFNTRAELTDELLDEFLDPSFEIREEPDLPGGGVWRGREGAREWRAEIWERWEVITLEAEEWIEGPGLVVLLATMQATGKGAGVPVTSPLGQVFEFAEGRICRIRYFGTHQQALDLAGSLDASFADA